MKLICSLGHRECDGHTVHKLSQRRLTADWLAPQERDCSWMHSKVSSKRLPSYIKVTPPFLEIFKMTGYFPDSPGMQCVNGSLIAEQTNVGVCRNVAPCALVDEYQWSYAAYLVVIYRRLGDNPSVPSWRVKQSNDVRTDTLSRNVGNTPEERISEIAPGLKPEITHWCFNFFTSCTLKRRRHYFLRNGDTYYLPNYTASHPRWP
jgi:hypothetical protein